MLLNNRCWNWNLDKVERSIDTSMCPPRSTPPSSPPIPRVLISTATSSPDSTVIIGFNPNRNSSAKLSAHLSYVDIHRTPLSSSAVTTALTERLPFSEVAGGEQIDDVH